MKNSICYCAVADAAGMIRNADNTAGARPPELVMGLPCELRLRLFANCEDTTPYPLDRFADVAGWSFEMDTDFSPLSTVKLVADNADIVLSEVTEGGKTFTQIAIPISETHTAELAAALGGRETLTLAGELIGYDAGHAEVFVLQIKGFTVRGRVAGLGKPTPIPTAAYDELARRTVDAAIGSGGYITSSGALLKNSAWTTTVGGYTMTFDGNGVSVYDSGASVTLRNGSVTVSTSEGLLAEYYNEDLGTSAGLSLGYGGASLLYDGYGGPAAIELREGQITANGSAITQVSSSFGGTSLGIAELSGGVKYVCQSALTALSIGSAAPGCNAAFFFTLTNGAVVTPPGNVPLFGVSAYTPGSRYVMAVNGDMAVVAEAVRV